MPVRYTLSGRLFRMEMEGAYTPNDIIQTFRAALHDPAFPSDPAFVFDVSRSDELAKRDAGSIRAITQFLSEHAAQTGHRCAVVTATPAQFGQSRMAATVAGFQGAEVQVFTTTEDAFLWLGLDVETGEGRESPDDV